MPVKRNAHFLITIHLYASMFFLPMAMIYAITGGLEILGFHGSAQEQTIEVPLETPLSEDIDAQELWVADQLKKHNLPVPRDQAQLRRGRFVWGRPTGCNVMLRTDEASNTARIRVGIPGFYRRLMLMHEARGGRVFNMLGVAFAVAMILIYISGILICWRSVKLRRSTIISFSIGLLVTAITVLVSM